MSACYHGHHEMAVVILLNCNVMKENDPVSLDGAAAIPTCFVEGGGRKLAYRSVGNVSQGAVPSLPW
jgi:hypothetical protein